jgi:hypothetical protein
LTTYVILSNNSLTNFADMMNEGMEEISFTSRDAQGFGAMRQNMAESMGLAPQAPKIMEDPETGKTYEVAPEVQQLAQATSNVKSGIDSVKNALQQAGGLYGNLGTQGLASTSLANQLASSRVGLAQTPQDILSKYASVVYGTPQASTTPSFAGTQGANTSSSSKGFKL